MVENWRDIPGYEDTHEVSDQGNVRSKPHDDVRGSSWVGKARKPSLSPYGYFQISLYRTKPITKAIHQLVAHVFLGPIESGMQVNHINGIRTDNRLENLEIVTPQENMRHSREVLGNFHGTRGRPVVGVSHNGTVFFRSARLADKAGFCGSHIAKCCRGKLKRHAGYEWSYA